LLVNYFFQEESCTLLKRLLTLCLLIFFVGLIASACAQEFCAAQTAPVEANSPTPSLSPTASPASSPSISQIYEILDISFVALIAVFVIIVLKIVLGERRAVNDPKLEDHPTTSKTGKS